MMSVRLLCAASLGLGIALAQPVSVPPADLDKLTVEELFNLPVTSVGRKAQELSKAPAAVFVLTADDIRRSGATCIPEALQWVPGLTVLHVDGRSWVVSARGDARLYADKILVLIDGRSLYTPLFSGVLWDSLDVSMDEIDRIEVVRGPGAVMWGPNAVNGVINIITKRARSTAGGTASLASGNAMPGAAELRWGAAPTGQIAYRFWGKADYLTPVGGSPGSYLLIEQIPYHAGPVQDMDEASGRMGFRIDGQPGSRDQWTVQGDLFSIGRHDPLAYGVVIPTVVDLQQGHSSYQGGYLNAQWTHAASPAGESVLQFTYDRTDVRYPYLGGLLQNLTLNYQNRYHSGEQNEIYWGVGIQQYWDSTYSNRFEGFSPRDSLYRDADFVLRDEFQFVPGRWMISLGIRLDGNSYHQVEYQPSVRLLFTPDSRQSAWLAVSRAIRAPNRADRDIRYDPGAIPTPIGLVDPDVSGNPNMRSEVERSLEAGYRLQSGRRWSVDASVFWSYYDRLRANAGASQMILQAPGQIVWPFQTCNCAWGRSYGVEIWATFQVRPGWRVLPSYSYLNQTTWLPPETFTHYAYDAMANIPHQAALRSQHDLSRTWKFDLMARARSHDTGWDLPGVLLLDTHLSWQPARGAEFSAGVENLTGRRVLESYSEAATPSLPLHRAFVIRWSQKF
jgi:iron complex outermembrane receptor protein